MKILLPILGIILLCGLLIGAALIIGRNGVHTIVLMDENGVRESDRTYLWDVTRDVQIALPARCGIPLSSGVYFG